jgi:hypothetical protein
MPQRLFCHRVLFSISQIRAICGKFPAPTNVALNNSGRDRHRRVQLRLSMANIALGRTIRITRLDLAQRRPDRLHGFSHMAMEMSRLVIEQLQRLLQRRFTLIVGLGQSLLHQVESLADHLPAAFSVSGR